MEDNKKVLKVEDEGATSATQPSDVDGGKISIFGSDAGSELKVKDSEDFYRKLLQLEDYNE